MIWNAETINQFTVCLIFAFLTGWICDMAIRKIVQKQTAFTAHITVAVTAVFLILYGLTPTALRCILLCQVLIIASSFDLATREIPDCLHLLLAMVGLIGFQLWPALLGLLLVPLPFLIAALKTDKIGGGDVKLMVVSGFALGVTGGMYMLIWGLLMAVLWQKAFWRDKEALPLVPFLTFGCFMALFPT